MATEPKGNDIAETGTRRMTADYGHRAGVALTRLVPGPHRDKSIARLFGCSVRTAKYLRSGMHWTTDRLSQAGRLIAGFDAYLASPDFASRIGELEREIAELREHLLGGDYDL